MESIVREEFDKKQEDIDIIIELTKFLEKGNLLEISNSNAQEQGYTDKLPFDDQLINVLKSVIYIMSYNQLEATARSCLESVYDHLDDNEIGYEKLKPCIQKEILTAVIKNHENGNAIHKCIGSDLEKKIPRASLNIKKVFNGNVCKDTFIKINKDYDLRVTPSRENRDGEDLDTLKNARNDLAHGNKSFSEYGATYSTNDFIESSKRVSAYISSAITAFDEYIEEEKYLSSHLRDSNEN